MSKFTKGIWLLNKHFDVYTEDGQFVALCCIRHKKRRLKDIDYKIYKKETQANARLIAAAPEMYELLSECADTLNHIGHKVLGNICLELLARIDGEDK